MSEYTKHAEAAQAWGAVADAVADKTPPEVRAIRAEAARFQCCGRWVRAGCVCSCGAGGDVRGAVRS